MKVRSETWGGHEIRLVGADVHNHGPQFVANRNPNSATPTIAVGMQVVGPTEASVASIWECGFCADPFEEALVSIVQPLVARGPIDDELLIRIIQITQSLLDSAILRGDLARDYKGCWHHVSSTECLCSKGHRE